MYVSNAGVCADRVCRTTGAGGAVKDCMSTTWQAGMKAFTSDTPGREVSAILADDRARFERRIARAKAKEYPRRTPEGWIKAGHARSGLVEQLRNTVPDLLPRVSAGEVSEAEFAEVYERGSRPVLIKGLCDAWPAVRESRWSVESLLKQHGDDRFKVGEDDDGYAVYVKLKYFVRYMLETQDDSPLYIFDSSFAEREATRDMRHDCARCGLTLEGSSLSMLPRAHFPERTSLHV